MNALFDPGGDIWEKCNRAPHGLLNTGLNPGPLVCKAVTVALYQLLSVKEVPVVCYACPTMQFDTRKGSLFCYLEITRKKRNNAWSFWTAIPVPDFCPVGNSLLRDVRVPVQMTRRILEWFDAPQ